MTWDWSYCIEIMMNSASESNVDGDLYLGMDVGGTKCAAVLGTARGEIVDRREWPSRVERGPQAMIDDFLEYARSAPSVTAAGVSIGGPLNAVQGIVLSPPHLPGWRDLPLKQQLEDELNVPVFIEHDAAACALAEYTWGDWKGVHALIYLTCGTGFGAGIVIDGRVYRGSGGHSIEIGHARFAEEGPWAFGKTGSLEAYCSGTALRLLSEWKLGRTLTPHEVSALARAGDPGAREVLRIHAEATGQVCANLADTLFPDVILLGSLSRHLDGDWLEQVKRRYDNEIHPDARALCKLQPNTLGERLQDLSAVAVAIRER
ncbi:MAG: ROK family protein [Candidatus Pacebacteria bacterium]|nr:ROK family protein [Candidatus Paceibacterota bacterium]